MGQHSIFTRAILTSDVFRNNSTASIYQFFESIRQTVQHADVSEQVPTMGRLRGDTGADIFWDWEQLLSLSYKVVATPSMIYPVERPAHVVSKSCPNLTALQPEDCQQAVNSWGVSDAELIVRLESFLLDPAIRPRQSLQSFAWNQRPMDVSIKVSALPKSPLQLRARS